MEEVDADALYPSGWLFPWGKSGLALGFFGFFFLFFSFGSWWSSHEIEPKEEEKITK